MGSIDEDSVDRCPSGLVFPRKADVCGIGTHFFTCGDIKLADSYQDSLWSKKPERCGRLKSRSALLLLLRADRWIFKPPKERLRSATRNWLWIGPEQRLMLLPPIRCSTVLLRCRCLIKLTVVLINNERAQVIDWLMSIGWVTRGGSDQKSGVRLNCSVAIRIAEKRTTRIQRKPPLAR